MESRNCDIEEFVLVVEAMKGVIALHVPRCCGKRSTAGILIDFPWADNGKFPCCKIIDHDSKDCRRSCTPQHIQADHFIFQWMHI